MGAFNRRLPEGAHASRIMTEAELRNRQDRRIAANEAKGEAALDWMNRNGWQDVADSNFERGQFHPLNIQALKASIRAYRASLAAEVYTLESIL